MDTPVPNKRAFTMAELMPGLGGILTEEARQTLTGMKQKQARPTIFPSGGTAEKTFKPMKMVEMYAFIKGLNPSQTKKNIQQPNSMIKKWNSSIKVAKKSISHTGNNHMKYNTVKKVLNFQHSKPKIPIVDTPPNCPVKEKPATLGFIKPEVKLKKAFHLQARNTVRISGVCHIDETPVVINKVKQNRITVANKENISNKIAVTSKPTKKNTVTPKSLNRNAVTPKSSSLYKRVLTSRIPETPLSNKSWKSSCDDSFIQNEKNVDLELNHIEDEAMSIGEKTLENIAQVSSSTSTPFKIYRNISDSFNNSCNVMNDSPADIKDDSITWVDKSTAQCENSKREESVIVSLCNMLTETKLSQPSTEEISTELDLLEVKKQALNKIKMIENVIKVLSTIKETELATVQNVSMLIIANEKKIMGSKMDKTVIETTEDSLNQATPTRSTLVVKPCSVIKSCLKSPSYKIPNIKMSTLKKKVHYKSLPNVSQCKVTPDKNMGNKALSMYLKIKENMNFLSTPAGKQHPNNAVMGTPAIASNVRKQLGKLYC